MEDHNGGKWSTNPCWHDAAPRWKSDDWHQDSQFESLEGDIPVLEGCNLQPRTPATGCKKILGRKMRWFFEQGQLPGAMKFLTINNPSHSNVLQRCWTTISHCLQSCESVIADYSTAVVEGNARVSVTLAFGIFQCPFYRHCGQRCVVQSMINMSNDQKMSCYCLSYSLFWLMVDKNLESDGLFAKGFWQDDKISQTVSKRKYFFSLNFLSMSNLFIKTTFLKRKYILRYVIDTSLSPGRT